MLYTPAFSLYGPWIVSKQMVLSRDLKMSAFAVNKSEPIRKKKTRIKDKVTSYRKLQVDPLGQKVTRQRRNSFLFKTRRHYQS